MDSDGKNITLKYNEYDITIKIVDDHKKTLEIIRKSLYLKKEEEQDLIIFFHDEDGDKIKLTEKNFDDAYESNEWEVKKKTNGNSFSEEEKAKIIREINEECNKAMKELNEKWKIKMENQINELKNRFRNVLEEREKLNQSHIDGIIKIVSDNAQEKIESKLKEYNENIEGFLQNEIKQSIIDLNKEKEEFNKNKNDLNSTQIEIKKAVEDSKNKFNDIMNSQMQMK